MSASLLFDTDVLIDLFRGRAVARAFFASHVDPLVVSAVTVGELYAGVREGGERSELDAWVEEFEVLAVDSEIAIRGGLFRRDYGKSHNVGFNDALIAATVIAHKATLVTLNRKHFPMLQDVIVPYRKP